MAPALALVCSLILGMMACSAPVLPGPSAHHSETAQETSFDTPGTTSTTRGDDVDHEVTGGEESDSSTASDPRGACDAPETTNRLCGGLDILVVVDRTPSMFDKIQALDRAVPTWLDGLRNVRTIGLNPKNVIADIHWMVVSSDLPHPGCAPETTTAAPPKLRNCIDHPGAFHPVIDGVELDLSDACDASCGDPELQLAPGHPPFLHFFMTAGGVIESSVPEGRLADAMRCYTQQGVGECRYRQPLEAMYKAIDPEAPWNQGSTPFLRKEVPLVVVFIGDGPDCSTDPQAYAKFTDEDTFWSVDPSNPQVGKAPSPGICWRAASDCQTGEGGELDCQTRDQGVLYPLARYRDALADFEARNGSDVGIISIAGVPEVTERSEWTPFYPTAGGVDALIYKDFTASDVPDAGLHSQLPAKDPDSLNFRHGIGPGCVAMPERSKMATPPLRIRTLCAELEAGPPRHGQLLCCHESICGDMQQAMSCGAWLGSWNIY